MPPKPKFTREEIIAAALEIASEKGIKALTARELGNVLGSSSRPIFTVFKNMDEVLLGVRDAAMERFNEYAERAKEFTPVFKQIGIQMVMFAAEQPKLYRLLFMSEKPEAESFADVYANLGETATLCVDVIQKDYGLSNEEAMLMFRQLWIYTYGVGSLIATRVCKFHDKEVSDMLSYEFVAMLTLIKSGRIKDCITEPKRK